MVPRPHRGEAAAMFRRLRTFLAMHAAAPAGDVALCADLALPQASSGAPDWVHLLPAGEIATGDGRGPYRVRDAAAVIAAANGGRLPIDENHSTDLAAPNGLPAPARGWIVELQARGDGVWGRVEWTEEGQRLVEGRAYRGISPVIQHTKNGEVLAILRASLVNRPNLRGLTALHQETDMDELLEQLVKSLGLPAETTADKLVETVTALNARQAKEATALQAALAPIAKAAGLKEDAGAAAVLAGVETLRQAQEAGGGSETGGDTVKALQAELTTVAGELKTLKESSARKAAEAFVDGAIKSGRVGVKPMRDHYVARHMQNPADVEKEIGALPTLGANNVLVPTEPPAKEGEIALQAEELAVCRMLGQDPKDYAETLKAEREANQEAL